MRKTLKRALICAVAAVSAAGLMLAAGCGDYYNSDRLEGDISGEVVSNGGFAVEKGNYVYYINGIESNTANNAYGEVQKGALMRISKSDLAAGNYASSQTVVPLVMYSGNYGGGIYIYGDYVYFSTPSTARDAGGTTLNSRLEFKRAKLDGTEVMSDYYFQSQSTNLDYRFVEEDGKVYLLYALSEKYDGEDRTNIHSVNLETRTDTLLAYDVSSYLFDADDASNAYVYYTMDVSYNLGTANEAAAGYNQIYRVSAGATAEGGRTYDFSYMGDDYDPETDPLYVNLGEFVFDGIGGLSELTQFNYGYKAETAGSRPECANTPSGYNYELISYENGTLYYTIETTNEPVLLYVTDAEVSADGWNPVSGNPSANNTYGDKLLLLDASSIADYIYLEAEDGKPSGVLYTDNSMLMSANFSGGVISDEIRLAKASDEITVLAVNSETAKVSNEDSAEDGEFTFLYYGYSGEGSSYSVHRIALGGTAADYMQYPADDTTSNYKDTQILDLNVASNWYMPEILAGHFFFASNTDDMVNYEYIMAFDLRSEGATDTGAATMSNAEIAEINDLYDDIMGDEDSIVADIDTEEYEYLPDALRYAFYTGDKEYMAELDRMWEDSDAEDAEVPYSADEERMYLAFITPDADNEYSEFASYVKKVNGADAYATSRNYYYNLVGTMTDDDAESYIDSLRTDYMQAEPAEEETGWFEGLSAGAKAGFIIGVCVGGIAVIGGAVLLALYIVRRKGKKLPVYKKSRIRVDTTDDKNIDVYGNDTPADGE